MALLKLHKSGTANATTAIPFQPPMYCLLEKWLLQLEARILYTVYSSLRKGIYDWNSLSFHSQCARSPCHIERFTDHTYQLMKGSHFQRSLNKLLFINILFQIGTKQGSTLIKRLSCLCKIHAAQLPFAVCEKSLPY